METLEAIDTNQAGLADIRACDADLHKQIKLEKPSLTVKGKVKLDMILENVKLDTDQEIVSVKILVWDIYTEIRRLRSVSVIGSVKSNSL